MRFSSTLALALPLLAAAESPFEHYKAQFQNFLSSFGAMTPGATTEKDAGATASSRPPPVTKKMEILTLDNWKDTLYEPVKEDTTKPEEWWVLVTGGNKTCYGHCAVIEAAFNETASKFAVLPNTPHMAYLNCDNQPILCNTWSVATAQVWVFDMLPPPAPIDVYRKRLNYTTTTVKTFLDLQAAESREAGELKLIDSVFHPFDGPLAKRNLAVPLAYFLYYFNMVPNWLFMLVISFASRSMMSRRMDNQMNRGEGARAPAPAGN